MDSGLYRDKNGEKVRVERTNSGYVLRYRDGRVIAISISRRQQSAKSAFAFAD
jgi:acyl-homoserine lactone acylase PvdQ